MLTNLSRLGNRTLYIAISYSDMNCKDTIVLNKKIKYNIFHNGTFLDLPNYFSFKINL